MANNKLYEQVLALYNALEDQSKTDTPEGDSIFTGSKVAVFQSLGLAQGHYSKLYGVLEDSGCVVQQQRGSSHTSSILVLMHPPSEEDVADAYERRLSRVTQSSRLDQRIDNIERRLPDIDMKSYIANLEQRLAKFNERLTNIEEGGILGETQTSTTSESDE